MTLADVARQAGVSSATASRVFGRPDMVGAETRAIVIEAADRLGYVANSTARALAMGSSGLLGLVVPQLSSSYFAPLISAVQSEVERSGFELIIVDSRGCPESEIEIARRLRGRVDGIIFASPRSPGAALAEAARAFPVVTVNRELPDIDSVSVDVIAGLTELCELLITAGHRTIAYLGGPPGSISDDGRFLTARTVIGDNGGEVLRFGPVEPTVSAGAESLSMLQEAGVHAVIAYNALVAHGLMFAAATVGARVPDDLAVAAVDDLIDIGLGLPSLTAITQPMGEAGSRAGRMLVGQAARPSGTDPDTRARTIQHLVLPSTLVIGETC
ncbi:LacI family DNA-binding transcriptional regulator [Brevibacterium oceani]|uniref:LacI family DNA-binding transcriptional regulator n=1 Tax=Brevibacterium oceani TaxID=358099 RepID=UPI0015E62DD9|nr:LacI family DNA-binding transcriptional regulator [Brevibacterium oceani]